MFSLIATFQQQHHTTQSTTWEKKQAHHIVHFEGSKRSCFTANCNSLSNKARINKKKKENVLIWKFAKIKYKHK